MLKETKKEKKETKEGIIKIRIVGDELAGDGPIAMKESWLINQFVNKYFLLCSNLLFIFS